MGSKIGNSLTECAANLSAMKLETSKVKYFVERNHLCSGFELVIFWNMS